jgi:hypothetical protein
MKTKCTPMIRLASVCELAGKSLSYTWIAEDLLLGAGLEIFKTSARQRWLRATDADKALAVLRSRKAKVKAEEEALA